LWIFLSSFFDDTPTTDIYTLSYTTLFRSVQNQALTESVTQLYSMIFKPSNTTSDTAIDNMATPADPSSVKVLVVDDEEDVVEVVSHFLEQEGYQVDK